jgi:uncharacterized protein
MIRALYRVLNALALALYTVGHAAVGTFLSNTRLVGLRDSRFKLPVVAANTLFWPVSGLVYMLRTGGPDRFLASLARPFSWRWLWRMGFTLLGARYIAQEAYRYANPRTLPPEVPSSEARDVDMREEIAQLEGARGFKALPYKVNEFYSLEVTTHEVRLERLPPEFDGFKIVQVSDVHYGHFVSAEFVRRYVDMSIELGPDLIALTGDYQQYPEDIRASARLLAPIGDWSCRSREGQGAVAILGNHDTWAGTSNVVDALREAGIPVLHNRHMELTRGASHLYVVGVADPWSWRADLQRAMLGVPEGACTLLLAHVPDFVGEAAGAGIDLQLSGHLHGGQIKLPGIGALLSPSRYNRRYVEGFHKKGRTLMYVSRGLGGHPPVRWACNPELAVFVLRSLPFI